MAWDHDWYNDLSAAEGAAVFPGSVMTARRYRDREPGGGTLTGSFTVPANGRRKLPVPVSKAGFAITVGGVHREPVETTPSSGQVQLDRLTGALRFHSSDIGGTAAWTMTPWVSAITGEDMAVLQAELIATQTAVAGITGTTTTTTIHVDKSGDDATGNGSAALPLLTIAAAIAEIGTPSATNRYVVAIGPGRYSEHIKLSKSYVTIRGAGIDATEILSTSAPDTDYNAALQIHTGTLGTSHASDTALAGVLVEHLTLRNAPAVNDGSVFCALCVGDYLYALANSVVDAPANDILIRNCRIAGHRDVVTTVCRGTTRFHSCIIEGTLDTIYATGNNLEATACHIINAGAGSTTPVYLSGTMRADIHNCVIEGGTGSRSAGIDFRSSPIDSDAITLNISDTAILKYGSNALANLIGQISGGVVPVINIYNGVSYADDGNRGWSPSVINFLAAAPTSQTMGQRFSAGHLTIRAASTTTPPILDITSLNTDTSCNPAIRLRHSGIDASNEASFEQPPAYTPAALTTSGTVLGEILGQTYQGGAWQTSARIRAVQSATAGNGDTPGSWEFAVCADGSTTLTTALTINSNATATFTGAITTAGLTCTGLADLSGAVLQGASPLVFEGATADAYETTLAITDPTADRTITLPDATGTVALTSQIPDLASPGAIGGTTPAAVTGTTLTATTQVGCEVYHSTTQTVNSLTDTAILFDSEDSDTGACHSTVSNTSRLTAATAGTYLVTATVGTNDDISGAIVTAWIAKNGAVLSSSPRYAQVVHDHSGSSGGGAWFNLSYVITLAANDYLEIYVNATLGSDYGSATVSLRNRASFKRLH